MSTSAVPDIIDALVTQVDAGIPTAKVYDGFGLSQDGPTVSVMIGLDNPLSGSASARASASNQTATTIGPARSREQVGTVTCAIYSWDGDGSQKAARDAAYSALAVIEGILRTDPSLGITGYMLLVCQLGDEELSQNQTEQGAESLLIFDVAFLARL